MPDVVLHYVFGQRVKERLEPEIREALDDPIYTFALYGPDQWFMHRPGAKQNGRGRRMHTTKTGLFLCSVADRERN